LLAFATNLAALCSDADVTVTRNIYGPNGQRDMQPSLSFKFMFLCIEIC